MTNRSRTISELARLGVATVYEASGRVGLIDEDWTQLAPAVGSPDQHASPCVAPGTTVQCTRLSRTFSLAKSWC